MSAAEGIEPIAIRLGAERLAAELTASGFCDVIAVALLKLKHRLIEIKLRRNF